MMPKKRQTYLLHRGRIQSQGATVNESERWSQDAPLRATKAVELTNKLEARNSRVERSLRAKSFADARRFIKNAAMNGGVAGHTVKSFMVRGDPSGRRIDIEIQSGLAFV